MTKNAMPNYADLKTFMFEWPGMTPEIFDAVLPAIKTTLCPRCHCEFPDKDEHDFCEDCQYEFETMDLEDQLEELLS